MKKIQLKFFCLIVICSFLIGGFPVQVKAAGIPVMDPVMNILGAVWKNLLEMLKDVLYVAAKHGAMKAVMSKVSVSIGGGAGGAKFIVDWRDALQTQPEKATEIQMQNLFSSMGKGAGNYSATDGSSGYINIMMQGAQKSVLDSSIPEISNLGEYGVNNPSQIFSNQKNMRAFMTAYGSSGKIGNKMELTLYAQGQKNKFQEINQRIASNQAVSNGGFYSTMNNGKVVTPGSSIRDLMASAQNMTFASLANAKNIQEAVGSLASRVISNTVKKGIGEAKQNTQKQLGTQVNLGQNSYGVAGDLKGSFGDLNIKR